MRFGLNPANGSSDAQLASGPIAVRVRNLGPGTILMEAAASNPVATMNDDTAWPLAMGSEIHLTLASGMNLYATGSAHNPAEAFALVLTA